MRCPRCDKGKAIKHSKYGILPCQECQDEDNNIAMSDSPEFYTASKADRVTQQRDQYAKDMLQPWEGKDNRVNRDFAKAYPDRAKDYFKESDLKKL
jgi:hypothetical protein